MKHQTAQTVSYQHEVLVLPVRELKLVLCDRCPVTDRFLPAEHGYSRRLEMYVWS